MAVANTTTTHISWSSQIHQPFEIIAKYPTPIPAKLATDTIATDYKRNDGAIGANFGGLQVGEVYSFKQLLRVQKVTAQLILPPPMIIDLEDKNGGGTNTEIVINIPVECGIPRPFSGKTIIFKCSFWLSPL